MNAPSSGNPFLWPILLLICAAGLVSCGQDNLGAVWNGGGDDDDDGDGGGGVTTHDPAPPLAWFDHALIEDGAPQMVAMEPGGSYATDVDTQSPILIWFNESLNPDSVTSGSVGLRLKETGLKVEATVDSLSHGRCIALTPTGGLTEDNDYEVFATFGVHDLDGELLTKFDEVVLGTFRTSANSAALPPRVVATFPPNGIEHTTDTIPVIAFSHPMKPSDVIAFLKVHPAESNGTPADPEPGSLQFEEAEDISNFQIWQFDLPTDDAEGAFVRDKTFGFRLTETNGEVNSIDDFSGVPISSMPTDSFWRTQPFLRPGGLDTYQSETPAPALEVEADVNLANLSSFAVGVTLGEARDAEAFDVTARISEQRASSSSTGVVGVTVTDAGWIYSADFRDSLAFVLEVLDLAVLPDGNLNIGAFVSHGGQRSSVRLLTRVDLWVFDQAVQDTVLPTLSLDPSKGMGPPFFDGEKKTFYTDLTEFRPFGMASEPISRVTLTAFGDSDFDGIPDRLDSGGDVPPTRSGFPYSSGWFLGPYLSNTGFLGGDDSIPFALQLTDAVGNVGVEMDDLELELVGYSAADNTVDTLVITAFDAQTLEPISVRVQVGDDEMTSIPSREISVSDWESSKVLTLVSFSYRTTTLYHLSPGTVSIPLRRLTPTFTSIAPTFDLNGLATEGEVLLGHSGFLKENDLDMDDAGSDFRPTSTWVGETPPDLGGGFGGGVELIDTTRPAWSAAFVDVENSVAPFVFDDDFTMDPRRILEPPLTRASSSNSPDWTFGDGSGGVQDITSFRGSEDIFDDWVDPNPTGAEEFANISGSLVGVFPMTYLPGIRGQSLLGYQSANGVAVKSEASAVAAYERGEDPDLADPASFGYVVEERSDGWVSVALGGLDDSGDLNIPVASVGAASLSANGDTYDFAFANGLFADGVYRFQLGEVDPGTSITTWAWDIWVLDGGAFTTHSFTLPDLSDSDEQLFGPLSTIPGTKWLIGSETWEILLWDPSQSFFFTDFPRQAESWGWDKANNAFVLP